MKSVRPLPRRRFLILLLVLSLLAVALPVQAQTGDVGRELFSFSPLTSDGMTKYGAVISADGSTAAYTVEVESRVYALMAVSTAGFAEPRELLRFQWRGHHIGVQGPNYAAADRSYKLYPDSRRVLALTADGRKVALRLVEETSGGVHQHFGLIDTTTGALTVVPLALPPSMGTVATPAIGRTTTYGVEPTGIGSEMLDWDISGDGRTFVWVAQAKARNGTAYALIAQDVATGQARRLGGYTSYTTDQVSHADPPGGYSQPTISPYGTKVVFRVFHGGRYATWVADYAPGGPAPRQLADRQVSGWPQITGQGEYGVIFEQFATTAVFRPAAGGEPVEVRVNSGTRVMPFYDGRAGLIEYASPSDCSRLRKEVRVVRPEGTADVLSVSHLPDGWLFCPEANSVGRMSFASADGLKALIEVKSSSRTAHDLWLLSLQAPAPPAPTTPQPGPTPYPGTMPPPADGKGQVVLEWPLRTGSSGYVLFQTDVAYGAYDPDWPLTDFPVGGPPFVHTGLEVGKTYHYTIFAVIGGIWTEPSYLSVTAVPAAPPAPEVEVVLQVDNPVAMVNGVPHQLDVAPFIDQGRTLVPLRFIGEQLGADIAWDGVERRVAYTRPGVEVILWLDRADALVNGRTTTLDVAPKAVDGRTVVPLRFVATALGAATEWDGVTRSVTIRP